MYSAVHLNNVIVRMLTVLINIHFFYNRPKMMFCLRTFCLYGRFVPPDVLSLRMFCPAGRFVFTDVLSLRTFCPTDIMSPAVLSPDILSPDVLSLRTFCLRTFCLGTVFRPLTALGERAGNGRANCLVLQWKEKASGSCIGLCEADVVMSS
jgi:hypothetical protein